MKCKQFLIMLIVILLVGCNRSGSSPEVLPQETPVVQQTPAPPKPASSISEYFPSEANTLYEYKGIGSEAANQQIFNAYVNGSVVQRYIISGGGNRVTEVLSLGEDQIALTVIPDGYYNFCVEDITGKESLVQALLLKEPLELGARWESDPYGGQSEVTNLEVSVETPYGTFDALEVSTLTDVNGTIYAEQNYYAKGVGLIKTVYSSKDGPTLGSELASIKKDATIPLPYYYYNPVVTDTDYDIVTEVRELEISTNGDIAKVLTEQFKLVNDESYRPVFSDNAKINSIAADRANNRLTVDLSKEFVSEMNAGAGPEQNILQAIVNTIGNLYRVGEARITVEGMPYESGHISMEQDEYMTVEIQGAEK